MIRVLIADDHTFIRHGLRQVLEAEPDISVVAEAQNGSEVLETMRETKVDVVVLDITMPGRNGLETLKELRQHHSRVAVIVLSMHPKDQYAVRVVVAGAAGYLSKESAPEELVGAIRRAYRGERYISPEVAELLADYVEHGASHILHRRLSDREFEVFRHLASGQSVSEIADELSLSVKTVSTYKARIVEKTGLLSISDITRYCLEHGIT